MIQRIFPVLAVLTLLAACETAPKDAGDAAGSGASSSSSGASSVSSTNSTNNTASSAAQAMTPAEELIKVGDKVYFEYDSSALSDASKATLAAQAAFLKANPSIRITVEGHCDERGTREYNLALGERRASAARDYLVAQGIDNARIKTISYGKERPAFVGSNPYAYSKNRRSVSIIR
ncbi:MAG: peptidoglycan-associated lipoprotein Pal [Alphaproteobacteria bacterium]|nr:peptidoglycan-associated lipoprotein Pal [Alphaproteobacteria bacterium]